MNCPYCNNPLPPQVAKCPHCGAAVTPTAGQPGPPSASQQKSPGLALFLSLLFGGIGQMYNGQVGKGILLLVVCILLWGGGLGFIVGILGCIDAYKIAKKINSGRQVGNWEWF